MAKLFLQMHLKSQWNLENKFAGQTDVPLAKEGIEAAKAAAEKLTSEKIDRVYTSPLVRNAKTVNLILKFLERENLPVI